MHSDIPTSRSKKATANMRFFIADPLFYPTVLTRRGTLPDTPDNKGERRRPILTRADLMRQYFLSRWDEPPLTRMDGGSIEQPFTGEPICIRRPKESSSPHCT